MNTQPQDQGEERIVLESSRGLHDDGARDCSDDMLPEADRYTDAERAAPPAIKWSKPSPESRWAGRSNDEIATLKAKLNR